MSKLEEQLKQAEKEFSKIVEESPETQAKRKVEKLKKKIKKQERKKLQGQIKANQSRISKALSEEKKLKERKEVLLEEVTELERLIIENRDKECELGSLSFQLKLNLERFDAPVKFRKPDISGIYEEEEDS